MKFLLSNAKLAEFAKALPHGVVSFRQQSPKMKAELIVTNIGQLITCASGGIPKRGAAMRDVGLIGDGAIAVADGKFVGVGKSADLLREFEAEQVMDAEGRVVCPGFVDPHTHIVFAGDRLDEFELKIKGADYLEILKSGGGIISTVRKTREASLEELVEQGLGRLDKMLECGTTVCEIKTGYGLEHAAEMKMLAAIEELDKVHAIDIVPTFLAAHAVPPEYRNDPDEYVNLICDKWLLEVRNWFTLSGFFEKSPCFVDVFCEKGAFDLQQTERILRAAKEHYFFGLKAHVDEFTNLGGSRLAIEMGAVSIDHLDAISDAEITILSKSDTVGIVTPTVNFNFGSSEFANARKLIDSGCAVAVSTDYNPGSAPCPSQPMAMAIACRYQKLLPSEALNAATINAAHAIGLGDTFGSIEVGKAADMIIVETRDYRELAYEFGSMRPGVVIKGGELIATEHTEEYF